MFAEQYGESCSTHAFQKRGMQKFLPRMTTRKKFAARASAHEDRLRLFKLIMSMVMQDGDMVLMGCVKGRVVIWC